MQSGGISKISETWSCSLNTIGFYSFKLCFLDMHRMMHHIINFMGVLT